MSWTIGSLTAMLSENGLYTVEREGDVIVITDVNGFEAFAAITGEQMVIESVLFADAQVVDAASLNADILRTHQVFPLTTVGISNIDGADYYTAFGALSSQSKEESVLIEVELLFQNVVGFLDAFGDYISLGE